MIMRYKDFGKRIFSIDELRYKLGIREKEYKKFNNFHQRVIQTAVNDINKHLKMQVKYKLIKHKRKFVKIEFKMAA